MKYGSMEYGSMKYSSMKYGSTEYGIWSMNYGCGNVEDIHNENKCRDTHLFNFDKVVFIICL